MHRDGARALRFVLPGVSGAAGRGDGRSIERAREAFAAAAEREAAEVQRVLSEKVAETSVELARKLAERPVELHRVTTVLAAVVAFGALCVHAGYDLAASGAPFWATRAGNLQGTAQVLSGVLSVPTGWMMFALLVPAAGYGMKVGWRTARDAMAERRDHIVGWFIIAIWVAGLTACAIMLAKVT